MLVQATRALQSQFANSDEFAEFSQAFAQWKSQGAAGEYHSYLFGKDSAYVAPKVDGVAYSLRHVHLVPVTEISALTQWNKAWKNKSRKTSDRVLVYVDNGRGAMLLIFILPEPDAHAVARMQTVQDKAIMLGFAEVAAAFIDTGDILA